MNTKLKVTLGLTTILTFLIMLGDFLHLIPDPLQEKLEARAALSETLALHATASILHRDIARLDNDFATIAKRRPDLISIGLVNNAEQLIIDYGNHIEHWEPMDSKYSNNTQIHVPLWEGSHQWGELQLRFTPLTSQGVLGLLDRPAIRLTLFLGFLSLIVNYLYLSKMLRMLDPAKAAPPHVKSAFNTMAEGLLVTDPKKQIVLANDSFARLLHKQPDELLGLKIDDLYWTTKQGKKLSSSQLPWSRAILSGTGRQNELLRLKLGKNTSVPFNVNCSLVMAHNNKFNGILISLDDVSELEKAELELQKSKDEAEAANHAKSAFLANMSHEIRTPMNAILGFTEILKRGYVRKEADSLRYLNIISTSSKNLLDIINDILDLSKVESGRLEVERLEMAPHRLIMDTLQVLEIRAQEKGLELKFEVKNPIPETITCDPTRLRQIIINIVGNAIKFTDQGGITVRCDLVEAHDTSLFKIDVCDTGIGMTPKQLAKIFNPFSQADESVTRRFGGTGLGLTISRKFAQALGGDIQVSSVQGQGSTFSISVETGPLDGVKRLQPDQISYTHNEQSSAEHLEWHFPKARVLVVDDGAENRELVRFLLEDVGLSVADAANGQEGLDKALAENFDLVLMDVQMPVMDGFTAVAKMRENGLQQPVIALTANAMKGFEKECLDVGYSGYLSKPIDVDRFYTYVGGLLGATQQAQSATPENTPDNAPDTRDKPQPRKTPSSSVEAPIYSTLPSEVPKFRELIKKFIERLNGQLDAIDTAIENGELEVVATLGHWLKGSGGTLGFDVFTEPAIELQNAAKSGNHQKVVLMQQTIRSLASRIAVTPENRPSMPMPNNASMLVTKSSSPTQDMEKIESRLATNPKLHKTICSFVDKLNIEITQMETACRQSKLGELAKMAHWLKGSAGTVGFDAFTEPAKELEQAAKSGQQDQAQSHLTRIKAMTRLLVAPGMNDAQGTC